MDELSLFRKKMYEPLGRILDEEGDEGFITEGPTLIQAFYQAHRNVLEHFTTKHAESGYTRKKIICDDGRHAVRCMEWAPSATSPIHEHAGRPRFDIVLEGYLEVTDYEPKSEKSDHYTLKETDSYSAGVGELVVVNPFKNSEVHKVVSPRGRSKSLHFYPRDHRILGVYKPVSGDVYKRVEESVPDD